MTTHTPGPWTLHQGLSQKDVCTVERRDGRPSWTHRTLYVGAGEKTLAEVHMWTAGASGGYPRVDNVEEQDANACLIIAAPDLQASLREMLALYDEVPRSAMSRDVREVVLRAEAALRRSEDGDE